MRRNKRAREKDWVYSLLWKHPRNLQGTSCDEDSEALAQTLSSSCLTFCFIEMSLLYRKEFRNMTREFEQKCGANLFQET